MSKPGLHKINRIIEYIMKLDVPKAQMPAQYMAVGILSRIRREHFETKKAKPNA